MDEKIQGDPKYLKAEPQRKDRGNGDKGIHGKNRSHEG
jgi:hypothetical protein